MYIAKLRGGSKRVTKFFQINLEKEIKWKGRENGLTKKDLKLKFFLLSKDIHPFILRLSEIFSFSLFSNTFSFSFSLCFLAPSLYFGILQIFEEKTNIKILFRWDGSGYTVNMKVGEVQIYWWWTHAPEWTYTRQYFFR
jgi:hypothetical protein